LVINNRKLLAGGKKLDSRLSDRFFGGKRGKKTTTCSLSSVIYLTWIKQGEVAFYKHSLYENMN
jgi:hypothetical protein